MTTIATRTHEAGMWLEYVYVPSGCLCRWSGYYDKGRTTPLPAGTVRLAKADPDCPELGEA